MTCAKLSPSSSLVFLICFFVRFCGCVPCVEGVGTEVFCADSIGAAMKMDARAVRQRGEWRMNTPQKLDFGRETPTARTARWLLRIEKLAEGCPIGEPERRLRWHRQDYLWFC